MDEIRLRVDGPDAALIATEIEQFLEQEFGQRPTRRPATAPPYPSGEPRRGDPIAVAALVLALPGAALATWDLAQRMRLKDKIERLLALIRGQLKDRSGKVTLEAKGGRRLALDRSSAAEVLDAAKAIGEKADAPDPDD